MGGGEITRRSLLAATAGAVASGTLRPHRALAALGPGTGPALAPELAQIGLGRLAAGAVRTVGLPRNADLVGLQWHGPSQARVQVRVRSGADWSAWAEAGAHGHGPDEPAAGGHAVGDPVWTRGSTELQLRSAVTLSDVRLHAVDVSGGRGARNLAAQAAAALPVLAPLAAAGAGSPPIIARRAWAGGVSPPSVTPAYGAVRLAFVHHTQSPNGYGAAEVPAMLRGIYAFHRFVNGWNDIGYNFAIDAFGRIFEARAGGTEEPVVGAHAGGYNLVSSGVAMLGSFMGVAPPGRARAALERLLAWKLSLHGLPSTGSVVVKVNPAGAVFSRFPANARVSLRRISGHRDGDSTDCPGDVLYRELPSIRAGVRRLALRPARVTLALASPVPVAANVVTGQLTLLDGTPLPGATVLVQARAVSGRGETVAERTLGQAVSDPAGRYALPVSALASALGGVVPRAGLALRALYAGSAAAGATVSDPLAVPAAVLTPPAPPAAAPSPTGATPPPA
jgi:hypothetical protein